MSHFLRLSRPRDKCLARTLEPSSAAQEFGKSSDGESVHRDRREKRVLALAAVALAYVLEKAFYAP
jgi:hypothetical protein